MELSEIINLVLQMGDFGVSILLFIIVIVQLQIIREKWDGDDE